MKAMTRADIVRGLKFIPTAEIESAIRDRDDLVFICCWTQSDIKDMIKSTFSGLLNRNQMNEIAKSLRSGTEGIASLREDLEVNSQDATIIGEHIREIAKELGYVKEA